MCGYRAEELGLLETSDVSASLHVDGLAVAACFGAACPFDRSEPFASYVDVGAAGDVDECCGHRAGAVGGEHRRDVGDFGEQRCSP
jgi:hypothetical protein